MNENPIGPPRLTLALNENNPACQALRDGRVKIAGVETERVSGSNIIAIFRRMCRTLEFDVSEMAVVTYFLARRYGLPMTAIPVFPQMNLPAGSGFFYHAASGIETAKDLEGKRVGLRAYTVTPHTWQRAYLQAQGVDISKITWVSADEDHVAPFNAEAPTNIEYRVGANLAEMLVAREVDAALSVRVSDNPDILQLTPAPELEWKASLKRDGVRHVIHLMVIKDAALAKNPGLAAAVTEAFKASKEAWIKDRDVSAPLEMDNDIMPIGLEPQRKSLEVLMGHALAQGILREPLDIDEIFPAFSEA
jgi:4,5-dihydroxyphthalate decarboxylase